MSDQPAGVEELWITNSLRDQTCEFNRCLTLTEFLAEKFRTFLWYELSPFVRDSEPALRSGCWLLRHCLSTFRRRVLRRHSLSRTVHNRS
jgi:hypothetical protein